MRVFALLFSLIIWTFASSLSAEDRWTLLGYSDKVKYTFKLNKEQTNEIGEYYTVGYRVPLSSYTFGAARADIDASKAYTMTSLSLGLGAETSIGPRFALRAGVFAGIASGSLSLTQKYLELEELQKSTTTEYVSVYGKSQSIGYSIGPELEVSFRLNHWLAVSLATQYTTYQLQQKFVVEKTRSYFDNNYIRYSSTKKEVEKSVRTVRAPIYLGLSCMYF